MEAAHATDHRIEPRSNIFVIATLYTGSGSAPVRVRNMSRGGALIEGALLPPVGSPVRLCRGSLNITGHVVWLEQRKAGLRFDANVVVADWLPNTKRAGQQLIDEVVHQARLGAGPGGAAPSPVSPMAGALHDELLALSASLQRAAEGLAADSVVAACHSGPLQLIDMAAQALAKLAGQSAAPGSAATGY